uniref:SGNH/GDSL hydrolase family protein n=1 Tax=Paractinoplanes polyasparticus TaxID=2856853 RepID=UPI001C84EA35|nr:GDSL-type esterase/lipase family protein [Actinoplanes polyasparticus]
MSGAQNFTDDDRRHFVRYTRTRSWPLLQRFPVSDELHTELLAQMLDSSPATISSLELSLAEEARSAAARLLAGEPFRVALSQLPFRPDDVIVAVGDSITADRLGWFDLLGHSLALAGTPAATLVNLGVSGNTTADVLERFDLLAAAGPTHVLLMLGTNDARAHGRDSGYRMSTVDETERNLRALIDLVTRELGAAVTVMTPPAVDQHRIDEFFRDSPVRWQAAAVAEVADVVRKVDPRAVDLHAAITDPGHSDLLESDGVHLSRAGQRFVLGRIVEQLAGGRPS